MLSWDEIFYTTWLDQDAAFYVGRLESRGRGKTELCAAVVETLMRQMDLDRNGFRFALVNLVYLQTQIYANRLEKSIARYCIVRCKMYGEFDSGSE